jgi:hypothetical protein
VRWLLEDGFIRLATVRGAPIKLHWSFFLTALFFGGLAPGGWLGYFLIIAAHELGHAALVWWCGHRVIELQVHGLGGVCRYDGFTTDYEAALISWGGVWAQGVLYLVTSLALQPVLLTSSSPTLAMPLLAALLVVNVNIMLLNVIPVPGFDGASAWRLFPLLWGHARYEAKRGRPSRTPSRAARPAPRAVVVDAPADAAPTPSAPIDPAAARAKDELFEKILRDLSRAPQHVNDEDP